MTKVSVTTGPITQSITYSSLLNPVQTNLPQHSECPVYSPLASLLCFIKNTKEYTVSYYKVKRVFYLHYVHTIDTLTTFCQSVLIFSIFVASYFPKQFKLWRNCKENTHSNLKDCYSTVREKKWLNVFLFVSAGWDSCWTCVQRILLSALVYSVRLFSDRQNCLSVARHH